MVAGQVERRRSGELRCPGQRSTGCTGVGLPAEGTPAAAFVAIDGTGRLAGQPGLSYLARGADAARSESSDGDRAGSDQQLRGRGARHGREEHDEDQAGKESGCHGPPSSSDLPPPTASRLADRWSRTPELPEGRIVLAAGLRGRAFDHVGRRSAHRGPRAVWQRRFHPGAAGYRLWAAHLVDAVTAGRSLSPPPRARSGKPPAGTSPARVSTRTE